MGQLDFFGENKAETLRNKEAEITEYEVTNLVGPDRVDAERILHLQRPPALLHYDYEQVKRIKSRSNPKIRKKNLFGRSLFIFAWDNPIRKFCHAVTSHWIFESIIIALILVSTVTLAFEHPLENPESNMMQTLGLIDLVVTLIFCLEALMKIITFGFILNGKKSYILNSWNVLDFMIVAFSVFSLSFDANLSFIKVLRVARILRPLRLIQKAEGLKIAILSLYKAIP